MRVIKRTKTVHKTSYGLIFQSWKQWKYMWLQFTKTTISIAWLLHGSVTQLLWCCSFHYFHTYSKYCSSCTLIMTSTHTKSVHCTIPDCNLWIWHQPIRMQEGQGLLYDIILVCLLYCKPPTSVMRVLTRPWSVRWSWYIANLQLV